MGNTATDQAIGRVIRRRRRMRGMKQADLAAVVGVGFQCVQKYEAGEISLTMPRLFAIARALNVAPSELIASVEGR